MPTPALMHDYLLVMRGAERTFAAIADLWPTATVHTLLYDAERMGDRFGNREVRTSVLQRLGVRQDGFRRLLPLYPFAAAAMDLRDRPLVVSSSSAFAHGVRLGPDAVHVCYCHTPFRYIWHERQRLHDESPAVARPFVGAGARALRAWDRRAAGRVTRLVANSRVTQERIADFWGLESHIVHPPVDVGRFSTATPEDAALVVCELVRHKRVDAALEAARRAGLRVTVVGTGPELPRLQAMFGDVATFVGRVDDSALTELYAKALVFVAPNVEEFGIAAVEAQAGGRPVLGIGRGGLAETVIDGETGVLVPDGSVDQLAEALRETDWNAFDSARMRSNAQRFSVAAFGDALLRQVAAAWEKRS